MKGSRLKGRLPFIWDFDPNSQSCEANFQEDIYMKWILACIDGTGSKDWRSSEKDNSHVFRFRREFGKGINSSNLSKTYLDGPQDKLIGSDSVRIKTAALLHIQLSINVMFPMDLEKPKDHSHCRVVVIGHSRGGAIAIDVARALKTSGIEVYFMGLFDAVDRSTYIDGGAITNVRHAYHALRGMTNSRPTFGNTGMDGGVRKKFYTSHGGIGGDVVTNPKDVGFGGDASCTWEPQVTGIYSTPSFPGTVPSVTYKFESIEETRTRIGVAKQQSKAAYSWILANARRHGLPI